MTHFSKQRKKRLRARNLRNGVFFLAFFMMALSAVNAQNITVTGKVTDDQTGESMPGVNVVEEGTTNGTITDIDGNYTISVPPNATLQFTFIGYTTLEAAVNARTTVNVSMSESTKQLDEVVAIGYGSVKRSDLTGSISSISGDELSKVPVANTAEAIKGRLPGVNIITTDGSPDAEVVIRVRGGGSITQDNSPLYVVDGFIVESIKDVPSADITSINVLKDAAATAIYGAQAANGVIIIETKSPLAGQTRVSYNGYMQFKTFPEDRKYDVLSPYDYTLMHYERAKLRSETDLMNFERFYGKYEDLELYQSKPYTDWQDEIFGDPQISQSHNVSINGGTAATKVSLSLTRDDDQGIMIGNGYLRDVINFKLNHEIVTKLTLDASARITNTEINGSGTSGASQSRIKDIVQARPINGIADELEIDLTTVDADDDYQSFLLDLINPVDLAEQDWRKRNEERYVLQGGLNWYPIEALALKTTYTSSTRYEKRLRYYGPLTSQSKQEGNSLPLGTRDIRESYSNRWLNTAQYTFQNLDQHSLDILVGHESYLNGGNSNFVRAEDFRESMQPEELFANFSLGNTVESSSFESPENSRLSFFGRLNYQLMNKYLATFTFRTDASSKFAEENRWGFFPAMALAWKMSEEQFIENLGMFNELKLRVSYGETGNDAISSNAFTFLFSPSTNNGPGMGTNDYNAYYSPSGSTLFNPDLIWETTINRNAGLDFMLFNGGLSGSFDVYKNSTVDLLLQKEISQVSGFRFQWDNIGSTSNQGVELAINANIIERADFSLSVNANIGFNSAKIEKLEFEYLRDDDGNLVLDDDGNKIPASRYYQSNWSSTDLKDRDDFFVEVGKTIGLIYGYRNDGMYTVDDFSGYDAATDTYILKDGVPDNRQTIGVSSLRPGYMKLRDLNGDGLINSQDREVIGNALPDATGGFGMTMTLKGFDLSANFNFSIGNDIYNTGKIIYNQLYRTRYGNMISSMGPEKRYTYLDVDGSYTGTPGGIVTDLEQLRQLNADATIWSGSNSFGDATTVIHDWAVEDGSFLRLNTLTLGYTIPRSLLDRVGISNFRIYATGYNLWLLTDYSGYDPEVSTTRSSSYQALTPGVDYSSYPRSRSFTVGVNVTF